MTGTNLKTRADWNPNIFVDLDDEHGYVRFGSFVGSTPTDIGRFSTGCILLNDSTGSVIHNVGTPAAPVFATFSDGMGIPTYRGLWNASTNTPTLASGVGTLNNYYIVSVAGSTNLDGITDWNVGDWAIFNGTVWQKIDNSDSVLSVNAATGAVVLTVANTGTAGTLQWSGTQLQIPQADTDTTGLLSGTDWTTFNNKVSPSRAINTGTGLSGGGDLSADRTIFLADTAVTPGSYTYTNLTIDAQGRITAAANGPTPLTVVAHTSPLLGDGTLGNPLNLGGLTGVVQGDMLYATGINAIAALAKNTTNSRYISNQGVGNNPIWDTINVANGVSGILPIANGGTNSNTAASAGSVVYSTLSSYAFSAVGATGQALISGATGAPTWFAPTAGSVFFGGVSGRMQEDNANFFWDDVKNFLGLGINTPQNREHLHNSSAGGAVATQYTNGTTGSASTDGAVVGLNASSDLVVSNRESTGSVAIVANGKSWTFDFNGNLRASAVHNNATAQGDANQQDVRSGTYTPTLANQTNLDGTATVTSSQWMRVGNVVTVSGQFTADPTLTATATSFTLTLPVPSNLANTFNVGGTATCSNIASMSAAISGNVAGDIAVVRWISTDVTSQTWSYHYTYLVLN